MRMRDLTMMIRWITHSCWLLAIFIQFCFDFIGIYSADDSIGFERTHIMRTAACASWSGGAFPVIMAIYAEIYAFLQPGQEINGRNDR